MAAVDWSHTSLMADLSHCLPGEYTLTPSSRRRNGAMEARRGQ